MQVKIDSIVYPGKSLSREAGKVIFTDEGLPGEIVEIQVVKDKANFTQGKTTRIIEPSTLRVSPRCDHYRTCSSYQYIDYAQQVAIKQGQIKELFSHNLGINLENFDFKYPERIWEYRNRIHLHVLWDKNNVNFAYHEPEQLDKFVTISKCHLVSRQINILLAELRDLFAKVQIPTLLEIEVKENKKGDMLLVLFASDDSELIAFTEMVLALQKKFTLVGAMLLFQKSRTLVEKNVFGISHIEDSVAGSKFSIGTQSFFQVNYEMLEILIRDIKDMYAHANCTNILDLYSGVGTFGITMAGIATHVICVESMQENIECLKRNVAANNITNISFFHADSQQWLSQEKTGLGEFLIVDPPRKGLGDQMCETILASGVVSLCYISCNPSTFIRDLKKLMPTYRVKKVIAYDFFPHTPHIEIAVLLEK